MTLIETTMEILTLQKEIKQEKEDYDAKTEPKKLALEVLKGNLIEELTKQGLKSIKTGDANFAIASRTGFQFTNEIEAKKWAKKTGFFSIDKKLASQALNKLEKLPDFVNRVENNYLTIKETNKE